MINNRIFLYIIILVSILGNEFLFGQNIPIISAIGKIAPVLMLFFIIINFRKIKLKSIVYPLFALLIYTLMQRFLIDIFDLKTYGSISFHFYLNMLSCLFIFLYIYNLDYGYSEKSLVGVIKIIALSGFAYSLGSIAGIIEGRFQGYPIRFLALLPAIYFFTLYINGIRGSSNITFLIISFFPFVSTIHKPAILSLLIGIFVSLMITFLKRRYSILVIGRFILIPTLILFIFGGINYASSGKIYDQLNQIINNQFLHKNELESGLLDSPFEAFLGGRAELWQTAYDRISKNPVFGYGFGQTSNEGSYIYRDISIPFHNGYIDMLLSLGLIGFLMSLIIFIIIFVQCISVIIRSSDQQAAILGCVFLAWFSSLAFYNMGGTSIAFYTINLITWIVLGRLNQIYDRRA